MTNFSTPASHLRQDYETNKSLFESQPTIIQRFLESQAQLIANAITNEASQVQFNLPDRVVLIIKQLDQPAAVTIPEDQRHQKVGDLFNNLTRRGVREELLHHLNELEQSPDRAIAAAASLLRFAAATHMVSNMLPDGRSVTYRPDEDEVIPSIPTSDDALESAITQASDAIAEQGQNDNGRGELQTPFVPAARRFYLPQWVVFDAQGKLLAGSEKEADAAIQSMQRYVQILHRASSLASYMVACDEYQRKRYGILGQLINQGRALATFKTSAIIREIEDRAHKNSLNRGLSISMPYFDDQNLVMAESRFEVIPAGRIMFVPAFVVRATLEEQAKVSQDTRLNSSTKKHLLSQLKALETAFTNRNTNEVKL